MEATAIIAGTDDLEAAKKELASLYAKGIKSTNDCKFERDALAHPEEK